MALMKLNDGGRGAKSKPGGRQVTARAASFQEDTGSQKYTWVTSKVSNSYPEGVQVAEWLKRWHQRASQCSVRVCGFESHRCSATDTPPPGNR